MCLITIVNGQSPILQVMKGPMTLREHSRVMLNPTFITEPDATVINYVGGKAIILLYRDKITTHSSLYAEANINVQILEWGVLKATCSIIPHVTTQNIPAQLFPKNYTVKIILRHRSLEYNHELVMRPLVEYIPIHIVNKVITINNPSIEINTFAVDYRIYFVNNDEIMPLHQAQGVPAEVELSNMKYRIELTKKIQFWDKWMQYGQWMQDIEIQNKEPLKLSLIGKPTQKTKSPPIGATTKKPNIVTNPSTNATVMIKREAVPTVTTTQVATTQANVLNITTMSIQQNLHQDIAIVKFTGGQILLYLGQHHLLIQTKLLDKAYVKVKLWQQDELVGRIKMVNTDTSKIIRFPATMNNSTVILQLYHRNYDITESHQQNLEQKQTIQMIPQKAYSHVYINQNNIHIPHKSNGEQRIQVFIKKGNDVIHEGVLPLTHKLNKGRYKIQFRKQIMFLQEWYTYKVWSQELEGQHKNDTQLKQKFLKRGNRITVKIPEAHHKRPYGIVANANYINHQEDINQQIHTNTCTASTFIILSFIFLFIFLLIISASIICIRRRNRHNGHSAFPLVNLF